MADEFITIHIDGLNEVKEMLDNLAEKEADRIIRKALRAGGVITQDAVQSFAPVRPDLPSGTALPPNALENDITLTVKKINSNQYSAIIQPGKATRHVANFVEYGHRLVRGGYSKIIKKGRNAGKTRGPGSEVGFVPAHPFVRVAFESTVDKVTELISFVLKAEVTKAANKK